MFTAKGWARSVQSGLNRPAVAFWLLALINLFVGGMVGLERTILPLLENGALGTFIISFGLSKALFNLLAGALADRVGRKRVLLLGWLIGLPIPFMLIYEPGWAVAANVLLGVNQALTWSMTVNMMVDLVPKERRGLAAGVNEFSGYAGVSLLAFLTGLIAARYGLHPEPFYLGLGVVALGGGLSLMVPETQPQQQASPLGWVSGVGVPSLLGAATNLKDGLVWLALPFLLADQGFDLAEIGAVAGLYPLVWAVSQLLFGPLSDRWGRKGFILGGIVLQGLGLLALGAFSGYPAMLLAALLLGLGTGMSYPTLIAQVADRAATAKRATALGIYRFFRDGGYAAGAALGIVFAVMPQAIIAVGLAFLVLAGLAARRL